MNAKDFKRGFMRVKYVMHNDKFVKVEFYYHNYSRRYRVVCENGKVLVTRQLKDATKFFNSLKIGN